MDGRLNRRVIGALHARLPEAGLGHVKDPRRQDSITWPIETILGAVVTAIVAGRKSLAQLESLTDEMSLAARRKVRLPRRIPDTTARDLLVRIEPDGLRESLRRQIRAAHRRKALAPVDLPFGVVSMDGKFTAVPEAKGPYAQARGPLDKEYGLVGSITATLISAAAKPCLDAEPVIPLWGEETLFPEALLNLKQAYGSLDLFQLVVYDAGACSRANARFTREEGLDYLLRVKDGKQPKLHAAATQVLGGRPLDEADAVMEERVSGNQVRRSVYLSEDRALVTWPRWAEVKSVVRVLFEKRDSDGQMVETEDRYYVTSLPMDALTPKQWIRVTRGHWAVENNCHHTWDAALKEDKRPWIVAESQGTLAVMLLRRIAYNILTLFRSVTLRSSSQRLARWRDICRWFYNAIIGSTEEHLAGLRMRRPAPLIPM